MKSHFNIILFILVACINILHSQTSDYYYTESKLILTSEDKQGKSFNANSESAYMILNLTNGDFTLKSDLSNLKTGNAELDSILKAQDQQLLNFKGNINENIFRFNQQINDENNYNMEGLLTLGNGNALNCIAQYDPLNFSEKSDVKKYRMDFKLVLDVSKITILGLSNKINNQVIFEIISGQLNTTTQ